jgi:hypothetical protein
VFAEPSAFAIPRKAPARERRKGREGMAVALTPIEPANEENALRLLAEGFPERPLEFWRNAFARMHTTGWNAEAGVPIGQMLSSGATPVGVMLTPASMREFPDGTRRRIVNLSSWYIRTEHRWRGLAMMRRLTAEPDVIYTDVTPTPEMHKLLLAAGFRQMNRGVIAEALPVKACDIGSRSTVRDLEEAPRGAIAEALRTFLLAHRSHGGIPAALEVGGKWHPLLFKRGRWRRLPSAELLFAPSAVAVTRHMGSIARFLLRRGVLVAHRDSLLDEAPPARGLRTRGMKFAKYSPHDAHLLRDRIDHAGTELGIFDL